jgi:hypothetical protein
VQITDEIEKIKSVIDRLHTILDTDGSEAIDLLTTLNDAFSISPQESKPKITVLKK